MLRVLHLYRPELPSTRAQAIQVLGTCWGLAARGCAVTLLADRGEGGVSPRAALEAHGLPPLPGLDLRLAPTRWPPGASLWFRAQVLAWLAQTRAGGTPGVVLARSKRYLADYARLPGRTPAVLESHELDSALDAEAGRPAERSLALELQALAASAALVTNCGGTMALWEQAWPDALPPRRAVVWNATGPDRVRPHQPQGRTVGYLGSLRPFKGLRTLLRAAGLLEGAPGLELLGGSSAELEALGPLPPGVHAAGSVPYTAVPDRVAGWAAAVVALDDNLFGRALSNPLKLWDCLAVGLPLVVPELPVLREVLGSRPAAWYTPGDPHSLASALRAAAGSAPDPTLRWVRTWADRADELLPLLRAAAEAE